MKKSILILGLPGSGKTTKMNEILSTQNTVFFKDEVVSCEEIENVHSAALKANSFCIVATQLDLKELSQNVLSNFEILDLNAVVS